METLEVDDLPPGDWHALPARGAWLAALGGAMLVFPVGFPVFFISRASDILSPWIAVPAAAVLGAYMAWEARNLGMSKWQLARMGGNIGVDWLLGLIPWVGAIPDFFFKSNTRNLRIIKRHLDRHHASTATLDASARR